MMHQLCLFTITTIALLHCAAAQSIPDIPIPTIPSFANPFTTIPACLTVSSSLSSCEIRQPSDTALEARISYYYDCLCSVPEQIDVPASACYETFATIYASILGDFTMGSYMGICGGGSSSLILGGGLPGPIGAFPGPLTGSDLPSGLATGSGLVPTMTESDTNSQTGADSSDETPSTDGMATASSGSGAATESGSATGSEATSGPASAETGGASGASTTSAGGATHTTQAPLQDLISWMLFLSSSIVAAFTLF